MNTITRPLSIPVADRFEALGGAPFRPDADRPFAADRPGATAAAASARWDLDGFGRLARLPARPVAAPATAPAPARSPEDEFEECERWDGMA